MKPDSSAARLLYLLFFWLLAGSVWAAGAAAVVVQVAGTVSAQRPDGKVRVLAKDSSLDAGEIVMTEKASSVRLKFSDGSQVTLRPSTRLVIEDYRFEEDKPADDAAVLNLVKGGLRAVSGLVGKRGRQDAHQTRTSAAIIGIRGTDYALDQCEERDPECANLAVPEAMKTAGAPPAGLYLGVFEGAIEAANDAGSRRYAAGHFGYVRDRHTPPVELPADPGLGREFPAIGMMPGASDTSLQGQGACLVR
jgi:hypothetical protein